MIDVYDFGGQKVRTAGSLDAPLFCAVDVCRVLGYEKPSKAYERLDQDECEMVPLRGASSINNAVFVNESGLFTLIMGSKKPDAKRFQKWVTSEVLPAIRRKGYYSAAEEARERETEKLLAEIFPNLPGKATPIFRELIAALICLRRENPCGNPPWARTLARLVYEWAFPIDGQQPRRREMNPNPNGSRVDYSMFSEMAGEQVKRVVQTGIAYAQPGVSATWDDWKAKMEFMFGRKSVQLPFLVNMLQLPATEPAAE